MAQLEPGRSYLLQAGITNQSTRLGQGVAATFQVVPRGQIGGRVIPYSPASSILDFLAGQTLVPNFAFSTLAGDAGQSGVVSLTVLDPQGLTVAEAQEPVAVSTQAVFYAIDTWEQIAPDTKYRYEDVACGWNAGPVRVDAHFLFDIIPTNISQALLRFFLRTGFGPQPFQTELRDPYYGLLGTENNSPPATITLDVTAVVKARGTLWVVINPAFWLGVIQFKYFGGIYDGDPAKTYWPRIEVS